MSAQSEQSPILVQRIVWGALTFSQVVHLGLALFIFSEGAELDPANTSLPIVLFGMGLMNIAIAVFVLPNMIKVPENPKHVGELFSSRIIQWAVIESGVVLGLVNSSMGGPDAVVIGLWMVALLGMLKTFPRDIESSEE